MSGLFYLEERSANGVATITLNRPDLHNAFNDEFILELIKLFQTLANDNSVRVVVLTGAGKSFCAGADLNWMKRMAQYSEDQNYEDALKLSQLFQTLNSFKKPLIGKINGPAYGGGAGLVAVCDYAIAVESALFGFTEVTLGLVPAVISPYVIAKIGESYARSLFLSGARFKVHKAKRMHLIHKVVKESEMESSLNKVVANFLMAAPGATAHAKELISTVVKRKNDRSFDLVDYTCRLIATLRVGEEGQEGMNALLSKSTPNWRENV